MKESLFHKMAEVEDRHWWFVGRRAIVREILQDLALPPQAELLEVGCGSGGNIPLLASFGRVFAVDSDPVALDYAARTGLAEVAAGFLPDGLPFPGRSFDLCCLLDVLEHLPADGESLARIHARLLPGGFLLVTVPACPALWSAHDELHGHQRRYRRRELLQKIRAAGFTVQHVSFFNSLLLPVVALVRVVERLFPQRAEADLDLPTAWLNRTLARVFAWERHLVRRASLPCGVSLLVVGRRDA